MKIPKKNWLEWSVFAIGLLLITLTFGYLAYDAITAPNAPPAIEVEYGTPAQQQDHFVLPMKVFNRGDQTAEGVRIEVMLTGTGVTDEKAELEIAFLPRRATREGWVTFQTDPRTAGRIEVRVLGYEKP